MEGACRCPCRRRLRACPAPAPVPAPLDRRRSPPGSPATTPRWRRRSRSTWCWVMAWYLLCAVAALGWWRVDGVGRTPARRPSSSLASRWSPGSPLYPSIDASHRAPPLSHGRGRQGRAPSYYHHHHHHHRLPTASCHRFMSRSSVLPLADVTASNNNHMGGGYWLPDRARRARAGFGLQSNESQPQEPPPAQAPAPDLGFLWRWHQGAKRGSPEGDTLPPRMDLSAQIHEEVEGTPGKSTLDKVIAGTIAAAATLPSILAGKVWKVVSYRFPVAIGTYVCAAICTRWVVVQVQTLWRKRPVKDLYLDGDDALFIKYGGILQREAHFFLSYMSDARGDTERDRDSTAVTDIIRAALELPCEPRRRDQYVSRLTEAVQQLETVLLAKGEKPDAWPESLGDAAPRSLSGRDLGRVVLYVRLADASLRLSRDSLVAATRRVQNVLRYWDGRYSPFYKQYPRLWRPKVPSYLKLGGEDPDEEEGEADPDPDEDTSQATREVEAVKARERRSDARRLVELEMVFNQQLERLGAIQAHLLRRPTFTRPTKEVMKWVVDGVRLASDGVVVKPPALQGGESVAVTRRRKRIVMDQTLVGSVKHHVEGMMKGLSWFNQQLETNEAETAPDVPFCPTPSVTDEDEDGDGDERSVRKVWKGSLKGIARQVNVTSCAALNYREDLVHYIEERGLGKPKLGEVAKLILRLAGYLVTFKIATVCYARRNDIESYAESSRANIVEFLSYRFIEPAKAILDDLVLNKRQRLTDESAIDDARESLQRMIEDFIEDTYPKMSPEKREELIKSMDMSVISDQYDKEIRNAVRNVFSGKIVRMLLIQIQFIKKELLVAMEAIDDLFNANKVNLQFLAVIPAVFTTYFLYRFCLYVVVAITSRKVSSTAGAHANLRRIMRDVERLLIMSPRQKQVGEVVRSRDGNPLMDSVLDAKSMGLLVFLLHEFQSTMRQNAARLDVGVRRSFDDDLKDLLTGTQTVSQQLQTLNRIRRSYGFLQVKSSGPLFDLLT